MVLPSMAPARWEMVTVDGCMMRLEQPDPQTTELPGPQGPSKTVPEEVSKLWASLPCCGRQRRHRRYFCDHSACCSHSVSTVTLSSIDTCIRILEEALAKFLHATTASILVLPMCSAKKRDCEDAAPPSLPAPANTASKTPPQHSSSYRGCQERRFSIARHLRLHLRCCPLCFARCSIARCCITQQDTTHRDTTQHGITQHSIAW